MEWLLVPVFMIGALNIYLRYANKGLWMNRKWRIGRLWIGTTTSPTGWLVCLLVDYGSKQIINYKRLKDK